MADHGKKSKVGFSIFGISSAVEKRRKAIERAASATGTPGQKRRIAKQAQKRSKKGATILQRFFGSKNKSKE